MGKKSLILLAVFLTAILGLAALKSTSSAPDPVYQGKRLSVWLAELRLKFMNGQVGYDTPVDNAIRHIGTNAFPMILQRLEYREPLAKVMLKHFLRHFPRMYAKFPMSTQRDYHYEAVAAIFTLHAVVRPLAPVVANALSYMDRFSDQTAGRASAGGWLQNLRSDGEVAIPALIRIIGDKN